MNTLNLPSFLTNRMNISAQPKLSPFRYPGGKTRLAELVHIWMLCGPKPYNFIEPFAGGASIGLYVASQRLAKKVKLIEIDQDVAAVWQTILSSDFQWLCTKIRHFSPTRRNVLKVLEDSRGGTKERAFKTLVRNRMGRGGLLWKGAGIIKVGERGKGLNSRWYPKTLANRIRYIHSLRDVIRFEHGCGLSELKKSRAASAFWFIDPPYTMVHSSAGKRLYRHSEIDHDLLFQITATNCENFLMTHENNHEVRSLTRKLSLEIARLPIVTAHNKSSSELLIGSGLKKVLDHVKNNRQLFKEPISKLGFL